MKTNFFLLMLLLVGFADLSAQTPKPVETVLPTLGFKKDTVRIKEGESNSLLFQLEGLLPKDSEVIIKWIIKDSDAMLGKDFIISAKEEFKFTSVRDTIQLELFQINTVKDANIENEKFTIEVSVFKGGNLVKLTKSKCVIILEDFKTDLQNAEEKIADLKADFAVQRKSVIDSIARIVNNDKDTSEVIGTIRMKSVILTKHILTFDDCKKNKGYKDSENSKDSLNKIVTISKVDIVFKYGVASEIRAFTSDNTEVFSNHWFKDKSTIRPRYGVSFRYDALSERNKHYYLTGEKNVCSYIRLNDLISYDQRTGLNFVPDNTEIKLLNKKDSSSANISVKTSLNSYINLNVYTDLLGLLKIDQGNGLIQSDVSAKIYLNTLPAKNRLYFKFNYLMPYARYARFENGFQNVPNTKNKSFSADTSGNISRMLLNQRKIFDVGLKLNIFNKVGKFDNTYELNAFTGFGWFNRQGPVDNVNTKIIGTTQYQGILTNTFEFGLESRASILQYRNFGINTGAAVTFQKIINAELNKIDDGGFKAFYRTEAEIFYYPIKNSKDKIFLRTYYTFNGNTEEESFLRVQVGYKALFKISNKK